MNRDAKEFLEHAYKTWGLKYPGITDDELSEILESRVKARDYSRELSERELQPYYERQRLKNLEEESQFRDFKALALEKWAVWYPGLPEEAIDRILLLRRHKKDYSTKLSLSEQAPLFLAEKARREEAERAAQVRRKEEEEEAFNRLYPPKSDHGTWLSTRTRPMPQPFGVSHQGAEKLVANWLEYLGEKSVEVTRQSGDGGADVVSEQYCCQVKNYSKQHVSSPEVRDLFGTAISMRRKPLLFAATGLTPDALSFANMNSIPAIQYDVEAGVLRPLNAVGSGFLNSGRYID